MYAISDMSIVSYPHGTVRPTKLKKQQSGPQRSTWHMGGGIGYRSRARAIYKYMYT